MSSASTSPADRRTALIFGASGITGWAILRETLTYPSENEFARVIALVNRPIDRSELFLPASDKLTIASGVDLTKSVNEVAASLSTVQGIQDVTDVYFAAYIQPPGASDFEGFEILKEVNVRILETAVQAVEAVSPKFRFWTLQTGGKSYGFVHVHKIGLPKVPCQESDPRIAQPFEDQVFYYAQYDALKRLSSGKPWKYAEIRPDLVVGYVPGGKNAMNLAQGLAVFLSFYADRESGSEGKKKIPFPGTVQTYNAHYTEIGQQTLGRAHIFGSSLPSSGANGEVYNVGDSPSPAGTSWKEKWVALCGYFGLEGIGPDEESTPLSVAKYMAQHADEVGEFEAKHGLRPGVVQSCSWEFVEVMLTLAAFDRQYDLAKVRHAGFKEQADIIQNYLDTFELMKRAKIIP